MNGLLFINKPVGMTSFDCIRQLKQLLPAKTKIGHAGTLDPFASGLLIVGIGKATQMLQTGLDLDKTYAVKVKLGELRDTLDRTGTIIHENVYMPENIYFADWAKNLMPEYTQTPPIYSNVKLNGQALHRIARSGAMTEEELTEVARTRSKTCKILQFAVADTTPPFVIFTAQVSKGTYIRSLANDIAQQGKTVATVYELTRTAIGNISIKEAISIEKFTSRIEIEAKLIEKPIFFATSSTF